jgi:hypothetical protein
MKVWHAKSWWWVDALCGMLDPAEHEVVRGDLTESGESTRQAFRQVLGLVFRRQAAVWANWQPWLCLVGLIIPLSMVLSIVCRRTTDPTAVYLWMYANNWDWQLLTLRGFWYQLSDTSVEVGITYLTLICWSWSAGFLLGAASRRAFRANSVLLGFMLAFGAVVGAPLYLTHFERYLHLLLPPIGALPDPVFSLAFYRVFFPLLVQAVLVLLPSLFGMRAGARRAGVRPVVRVLLYTAAITTVVAMVMQSPDLWMFLRIHQRGGTWLGNWQGEALRSIVYWPLLYLLATTGTRLLRTRHILEPRRHS